MARAALKARAGTSRSVLSILLVGTAAMAGPVGEASAQAWQDRLRQLERGAAPRFDLSADRVPQIAQAAAQVQLDIPPQPLADALTTFGRQSGMQVSVDAALVRGISSPGVRGSMTAEQGLARLLAGTGITYRMTGGSTALLQRAPAGSPGAVQLDTVTVEGATVNPKAEIGSTPPPYAGNQVARGGRLGALGNRDMMDTPFSVTSFTSDTIRDQQAETLADVLANDPAVRTTYGFGNFSEQFIIRGFPLIADDISIDGLYGLAPRQIVSTEMYERIEVLRGANAFLNGVAPGNSGIGGGINLVPKRAGDEPLTRVTAGYAQDSRFGGHLDVGRRFGPDGMFGIRANVALRDGETAVDDEKRTLELGSVAFDFRGDRARATLDVGHQRQHVEQGRPVVFVTGPTVPSPPSANHNYAQNYSFSELRDTFAQFRGEYDITSNIMGYVAFGGREMREDGDYTSPTVNGDGIGTVSRLTVPREDNALSGQTGIRLNGETGSVKHTFDVGVAALRTVNRNSFEFSVSQPTNIYASQVLPRPATAFASGNFDDLPLVSRSHLRSVFLADTASVLNDRVLLTVGIRRQWMDIEGFDRDSGAQTADFNDSATSPVVGIVVKPTDQISLYANRIEGLAQGPTAPAIAVNSGEIFAPFKSVQYEVGGKLDLGRFGASVALFQTKQPTGLTDPNTLIFDVSGEQRNRGVEFLVFGEPVEGLRLLGGITFTDAILTSTAGGAFNGNDAVGVPDYQANFGIEWDPSFLPGMTLAGRVLQTGSQFVDQANTLKIPDWTRLDVGARYRMEIDNRPIVLRANIENVTNEAYWASANGGYLLQGYPLTAKLSASVDF
jgi:iron complex outermembrane receptor protein